MEAEELMKIFDRRWFESDIFDTSELKRPSSSSSLVGSVPDTGAVLSWDPKVLVRSMSDQLASQGSFSPSGSLSPDSVLMRRLGSRKLRGITLGREPSIKEEEGEADRKERRRSLVRRKGTMSKSLSELEFEEVKGFMDLGFVFSEEDKDSSLAEIIPGLHRLGKRDTYEEGEVESHQKKGEAVPRPYLSESWEWWETRRKDEERQQALTHWEVPDSGDDSDIKLSLRLWAHNVASAVQ